MEMRANEETERLERTSEPDLFKQVLTETGPEGKAPAQVVCLEGLVLRLGRGEVS